ncbi:hypothetical protein JCM11251_006973 [Rhodosporidiobolus azoricus]
MPKNVYHGYRGVILNPQSTPQQRANALKHMSALEQGAHHTQTQNQGPSQALVPVNRSSPYGQAYAAHRSLPPALLQNTSDSPALQAYHPPSNALQQQQSQQPAWSNSHQTQKVEHFRVSHPALKQDINVERTQTTTVTEEWRIW